MKFYCDNCQTKYSIADEKVRGKVLKVRCKQCNHVVTVRDKSTGTNPPVSASGSGGPRPGSAAPPPPPQKNPAWHYSVNGQSFGPVSRQQLEEKLANGQLGDATFVWNDTFTDWKSVQDVAVFARALRRANPPVPPPIKQAKSGPAAADNSAPNAAGSNAGQPKPGPGPSSQGRDRRDRTASKESAGAPRSEATAESGGAGPVSGQKATSETESALSEPATTSNEAGAAPVGDGLDEAGAAPVGEGLDEESVPTETGALEPESTPAPEEDGAIDEFSVPATVVEGPSSTPGPGQGPHENAHEPEPEDDETLIQDKPPRAVQDLLEKGQARSDLPSQPEQPTPQADDASQGDRLQALRDRLKLDSPATESATPEPKATPGQTPGKPDRPEPSQGPSGFGAPDSQQGQPIQSVDGAPNNEAGDIAHAETLLDSSKESSASNQGQSSPTPKISSPEGGPTATANGFHEPESKLHQGAEEDGLFSGFEAGQSVDDGPSTATPEAAEFEGAQQAQDDAVPFFPSAPKLGDDGDEASEQSSSSLSRVDEMTGSLLIQINEIKSDGRKRAILTAVGALAALAVLGVIISVGWSQLGSDDEEFAEDEGVRMDNVGGQPVFREYSSEELARISEQFVVEEQLVVSREDSKAAYDREERREQGGRADTDRQAQGGGVDLGATDYEATAEEPEPIRREEAEAGPSRSRFARPELAESDSPSEAMAQLDDLDDEERREMDSRFEAMAALQSDTERGVHGADGDVELGRQMQEGLSSRDISRAMDSVMESVGICRERHIYRGGTLEEDQLRVSITVLPDSDVGQFSMSPSTLEDTDFGRCMESHTGRWPFPRFKGDPVEIQAPFALQ